MARENKPGSPKRAGKSGGPVAKPKASTSYSPAPMSAAAKAKAAAAGKATAAKTKNPQGLKQMNFDKKAKSKSTAAKVAGVVGKVAGRAKTVAREARDIPTAVSTAVAGRNVGYGGNKFALKDLKTQLKEVASAAKSGKRGTAAAQVRFGGKKKGTVGAGSLDQNVSKPKAKRK